MTVPMVNKARKKVFISFDFEGLAGVTSWQDVDKKSTDYKKESMLIQLKAFLKGLGDAEVLLVDSHDMGDNITWELSSQLSNVSIVSGGIRKHYMMHGIDDSFDYIVFFGYHAGVGTLEANMDHTYSNLSIHNIWINNISMNEALINAAFGGLYNVPVGCLVGDDKAVIQTKEYIPNALYVTTKKSVGRHSAIMRPFNELLTELEKNAKALIEMEKTNFTVFKFAKPVELVVEFTDTLRADLVSSMPLVERIDGRKVRIVHDNYDVIFEALLAMTYICTAARLLS